MSLINDALKRARQAQQNNPPPAVAAPLRPAEKAAHKAPASGALWLVLAASGLGVAAAVLIFVALQNDRTKPATLTPASPEPKPEAANTPVAAAPNLKPAAPTEPIPQPVPAVTLKPEPPPVAPLAASPPVTPAVAPATNLATQAQSPESASPTNVVVQTPPAPPAVPALPKLQGIFYRPDRPSALLNGKTVFVGGRSGEFGVVAITKDTVTVVRAGETNVLTLPE